jgi:metal-responsive CopG/Arc/MetJ family transcriptional regulator
MEVQTMKAKKRLVVYVPQEFINELENYKRKYHFSTRNSALLWLLEKGLENTKVGEGLESRVALLESKLAADEHAYYELLHKRAQERTLVRVN